MTLFKSTRLDSPFLISARTRLSIESASRSTTTMPQSKLTLPQQFGRFLVSGALVFGLMFWALSQVLISSHDAHIDFQAVRLILKAAIHQPFASWLQNVETYYFP